MTAGIIRCQKSIWGDQTAILIQLDQRLKGVLVHKCRGTKDCSSDRYSTKDYGISNVYGK